MNQFGIWKTKLAVQLTIQLKGTTSQWLFHHFNVARHVSWHLELESLRKKATYRLSLLKDLLDLEDPCVAYVHQCYNNLGPHNTNPLIRLGTPPWSFPDVKTVHTCPQGIPFGSDSIIKLPWISLEKRKDKIRFSRIIWKIYLLRAKYIWWKWIWSTKVTLNWKQGNHKEAHRTQERQ